MYYFSFMGRSGQFFLDENKVPVLIPQQDIKINLIHLTPVGDYSTDQKYYTWVITTNDGVSYLFGDANVEQGAREQCLV